jgi:hypothetical protein
LHRIASAHAAVWLIGSIAMASHDRQSSFDKLEAQLRAGPSFAAEGVEDYRVLPRDANSPRPRVDT